MKYTLEQLDQVMATNILIVGRPGTGKTKSLATLHKLRNRKWLLGSKLMVADFDQGVQPLIRQAKLEGWASELDIRRYSPPTGFRIETTKATPTRTKDPYLQYATDINQLYDWMGPDGQWLPKYLDVAPYCVVVDSMTSFADHILNFTLILRSKELGNAGVDGRQEFGMQMGKIVEAIRALRGLPCLTVVTAHVQTKAETVKGTATPAQAGQPAQPARVIPGRDWQLPVITGQLANSIAGEFGIVLYTDVKPETSEKDKYIWYTRPVDNIFCAKTRLRDGLPREVIQDFNVVIE